MDNVRPMEARDLEQVADLHDRVMATQSPAPARTSREYVRKIFLDHPWSDGSLTSLVYEDKRGNVAGCLGVMPRPMAFNGSGICTAVSHNFMVEPGSRSTLAGIRLAKAFLAGPQDMSITEGNNTSRRLWEGAGGTTSLLYSLCWTRPVSPSRYTLAFLRKRGLSPAFGLLLGPLCRLADAVMDLVPQLPFRPARPSCRGGPLDAETLCACLSELSGGRSLRPRYDAGSLRWIMDTLKSKGGRGGFQAMVVRDGDSTLGWYVYILNARGVAEVAQMGARDDAVDAVFDHLFYHARSNGAVAVSGQVEPDLIQTLSGKYCFFHHDGDSWMLVHSKHPEVLESIHNGDASLSRLDGEWWISYLLR